jgi:hypothetical protein
MREVSFSIDYKILDIVYEVSLVFFINLILIICEFIFIYCSGVLVF